MAKYKNREVNIVAHMPYEPKVRIKHVEDDTEEDVNLSSVILTQKETADYFKQVKNKMEEPKEEKRSWLGTKTKR